jgi:superfamily II DNA/RNA helicase
MIQFCLNQPPLRPGDGPMALVLAPTRELAQQIDKEVGGRGPGGGGGREEAGDVAAPTQEADKEGQTSGVAG